MLGKGIRKMSEIVSSILASAQTISSPESSIATAIDPLHPATEKQSPVVADFLELSAFYSPNADQYSPEAVGKIKDMIRGINEYIGSKFDNVPNEDQVRAYIADIITRNKLDKLSPTDKLEAVYNYIDLSKRMDEVQNIKDKIKALHV
jgi:hypothetical protein